MNRVPSRIPLVALLLAAASVLLACVPNTPPVEGKQPAATPVAPTPVPVRGRVGLQGRATAQGSVLSIIPTADEVQAEVVAEGLEVPWELAFPPDGRILVAERPGRIRIIHNGVLQAAPWATLAVASVAEAGLMGMALHPQFATNGQLFLCYTYRDQTGRLANRVARLTDVGGVGVNHQVVLDGIPGAPLHDGCRLGFGLDGKLYVTLGDATDAQQAQNLNSLSGKVLRLEADGSVPADNPFPGSYIYTYGHRNPQGLAWHPTTGDLFITEHGPAEEDEVNILRPGGNYGWPDILGVANNPRFQDPILTFTPTIAPAGAAFFSGQRLPASWQGNFIFANLKGSHLRRVVLASPDSRTVLSHQSLFQGQFGRLRAVALAPDGYLYFTTSNRDGRGAPRPGDDKVLRLIAAPSASAAEFHPDSAGVISLSLKPGAYQLRWAAPGFVSVQRPLVVLGGEGIDLGTVVLRAGDLDGDGAVDGADLVAMRLAFGKPALLTSRTADFNADGAIDVLDLALLASNWGRRE